MSEPKPGSYTAAFSEALVKLGEEHPELVAITAAMPDSTGLLPFQERFPDRCFDVGIAEQHAVTAAAGMAMGGLRPVVAIYSTFLTRAIDQVIYDVGLHGQPVIFCLDRAGITGDDGASHHGVLDMVLLTKVPGMTVFAPSSYQELQQMLRDALEITTGPVAIRWPKTPPRIVSDDEVGHGLRARRLRTGADVCLLAVGKLVDAAEQAAELLAADGIAATRLGRPGGQAARPRDARRRRHPPVRGHRRGRPARGRRRLGHRRRRSPSAHRPRRSRCSASPLGYIAHGKPDAILAELGLDADGIAASVRAALRTRCAPSADIPVRAAPHDPSSPGELALARSTRRLAPLAG